MDGWQKPGSEKQLKTEDFGRRLYDLVFDEKIRSRFTPLVEDARGRGENLRLALNLCGQKLSRIPFELLHDGDGFLMYGGARIVRIFDELSGPSPSFGPFRRLLVILAEPGDQKQWGHDEYLAELEKAIQAIGGIQMVVIPHATREIVLNALRERPTRGSRRFDAVHIVAHGHAQRDSDAELMLENSSGGSELVAANVLSQAFKNQLGCFVYLNSCSTALAIGDNPFAGYAQRLMRDGGCGAVFAMQKPISVSQARSVAQSFFTDLARGNSSEVAAHWALTAHTKDNSWAIPCLYTRLSPLQQERRDRIAAFFSADPGTATFAFYLPEFRMGFFEDDYRRLADSEQIRIPGNIFNYKGRTNARSDVDSATGLISLLGEILPPGRAQEAIEIFRAEQLTENKASHIFAFGSKSHGRVQDLLKAYSKHFAFEYKDPVTGSDDFWKIEDRKEKKVYAVRDPSKLKAGSDERAAANESDYAVIEKIIDQKNDRVIFVLAGLQDRGTRGAGEYLLKHWEDLVAKYGASPFQVLLKFEPGLASFGVSEIERKTEFASGA
jgi:hypothetical protein